MEGQELGGLAEGHTAWRITCDPLSVVEYHTDTNVYVVAVFMKICCLIQ